MRVTIEFYIVVALVWTFQEWYVDKNSFKMSFIVGFTWLFEILYEVKNNIIKYPRRLLTIQERAFYEDYYMIQDHDGNLHKPTLRDIDYHIFEVMEKDGFKGF